MGVPSALTSRLEHDVLYCQVERWLCFDVEVPVTGDALDGEEVPVRIAEGGSAKQRGRAHR